MRLWRNFSAPWPSIRMHRTRRTTLPWRSNGSARGELLYRLSNRPPNRFAAGHFGTPPKRFHAAGVESDLRNVARPSARAAGVFEAHAFRVQTHGLDRPLRDLVD